MMDWNLSIENQKKYNDVVNQNYRLQAELGIKSKTLEERAQDHAENIKQQEALTKLLGVRRPAPKWKL
jgi:hypothetical protein